MKEWIRLQGEPCKSAGQGSDLAMPTNNFLRVELYLVKPSKPRE